MELLTYLKKKNGRVVKVGSGSSFVFCGRVDKRTIEKTLDRLSAQELESLKRMLTKTKSHKLNFNNYWEKRKENAILKFEELNEKKRLTYEEKKEKLNDLLNDLE